ncbi:hypothetical protein HQN87_26455 [Paenibacillus tritici]|uniref:Flavodoxin-like domain-containing protein n=1 Tax=Paenibacillus tritici TaxID=1873425 RepID=A0ABX2DVW5_9BACL|nr:flavodoxin domain-containing protein [Paenibacillus tritici]NQX48867.1 hypothetical protein [Paenibacillus tritici]
MRDRMLIVYAGKYGCTEKAASLLQSRLEDTEVVNLKVTAVPALDDYDAVILGSAIYYGRIRKEMARFIAQYEQELLSKRLGLFICAGMTGERAEQELQQAYPEALYKNAVAKEIMGDEIDPDQLSVFDKWVLRMVKGKGHGAGGGISLDKLERFACTMLAH